MPSREATARDDQIATPAASDDDGALTDLSSPLAITDRDDGGPPGRRDACIDGPYRSGPVAARHGPRVAGASDNCQERSLRRGDELARYVILDLVGTGGSGAVYRAFDPDLERTVAIKVPRVPDREADHAWLLHEARSLARISHPNVVTLHDVGVFRGMVFVAMEMLEGSTLAAWIERAQPSWRELTRVFEETAAGLDAMHDAGLLHRDVKPSNIVITSTGHPKLVDFGLALGLTSARRQASEHGACGTWHFMAPEVRRGQAPSFSSDLYALSLTFCEALSQRSSKPPRWFRSLLIRGCARSPQGRPPSVKALRTELRRGRRRRAKQVVALGTGLAAAAALGLGLGSGRPSAGAAATAETQLRSTALRNAPGLSDAIRTWRAQAPKAAASFLRQRDAFEATWEHAYATHVRRQYAGAASNDVDKGRRCLDFAWSRFDSTIRFGLSSPQHQAKLSEALGGVPDPSRCFDGSNLAFDFPSPRDPTRSSAVSHARTRIQDAMVRLPFVRAADVASALDAIGPEVSAIDFDPLTAEFESQRSQVFQICGELEAAAAAGEAAVVHAARAGYARATVRSTETLVIVLAELGRLEAAAAWAQRGLADSETMRGLEPERAGMLRSAALVARRSGDFVTARRRLLEALAIYDRLEPDVALQTELRTELASLHAALGNAGEAIVAGTEAAWLMESEAGPLGPHAIAARVNLGRIALKVGRPAFAAKILEDAIDRYEPGVDATYQSFARMLLGSARIQLGDTPGARAMLEEAWDTVDGDEATVAGLRAKIARQRALSAIRDGTSEERDHWNEVAVAAARRTQRAHYGQEVLATALEDLLAAGDCGAAKRLATNHSFDELTDRIVVASARVDVCMGRPDQGYERLRRIVAQPSTDGTTMALARVGLHEAYIELGDIAGARENLSVAMTTLDEHVLSERAWAALVTAASVLGPPPAVVG